MPSVGTVFQLKPADGNHFWVVISDPVNGNVLTVNITDATHYSHSTCHISPGEHPEISKPSVVFYRKAREFDAANIDAALAAGSAVRKLADASLPLLARIIAGAKSSDELTAKFRKYLR